MDVYRRSHHHTQHPLHLHTVPEGHVPHTGPLHILKYLKFWTVTRFSLSNWRGQRSVSRKKRKTSEDMFLWWVLKKLKTSQDTFLWWVFNGGVVSCSFAVLKWKKTFNLAAFAFSEEPPCCTPFDWQSQHHA